MTSNQLHVIVGLGATGVSCVRYLTQHNIPIAITDSRLTPPNLDAFKANYPDVQLALGELDTALLSQAANIIISPGMALREPAIAAQIEKGISVIGDIELFARAVKVPVIAITGTNAKSTVTTLVGLMAEAAGYNVQVGGNLGVPALDLLAQNPDANLFVLELSSFQLETTSSLKPAVATVLNITPDHMDRYDTLEDYAAAKHRVYLNAKSVVCNHEDTLTETDSSRKFYFTLNAPGKNEFGLVTRENETHLAFEDQLLMSIKELPVMGKHYQANALASLAIGHAFGLPMDAMLTVLREFKGLPHRCQFVRELNGVTYVNDSKGTNVGATEAAIIGIGSEIKGKLVMIMGGLGKNADFYPMMPLLLQYARHVVLIGTVANELADIINQRIPTSFATDMTEAVNQAREAAQPDDCVLLSPACASMDMFKHYEHRGDVFTETVKLLK